MAAYLARTLNATRQAARRGLPALAMVPVAMGAVLWWLNEPLDDPRSISSVPAQAQVQAPAPDVAGEIEAAVEPGDVEILADQAPSWPSERLEGEEAKRWLHDVLEDAAERLSRINTYTATFRKRERIKGELGPEQTLAMKARHQPFSMYLKFLAPRAGKEVVYAEGRHDNHVIAHNGDWTRRLIPRLRVLPDSSVALADNRHPITEAGLHQLTGKLLGFRKLDLDDPEAETVLDWVAGPDGRQWPWSLHTHPNFQSERPFARVEVLYDPDTLFPRRITSYDWPAPGHVGDLLLAEQYAYDDLQLDAPLSDLDFDPANPTYEFTRY